MRKDSANPMSFGQHISLNGRERSGKHDDRSGAYRIDKLVKNSIYAPNMSEGYHLSGRESGQLEIN